jgi:hypothetical protein
MRSNNGMIMRRFSAAIVGAGLAFLAACGGSSNGGGNITGVAIGLSPSARSVGPAGVVTITATVNSGSLNWSLAPAGFGTLSSPGATGVTYTAPTTVSSPTVITITATSTTSTSVSAPVQLAVQPSPTIALQTGGKTVGPATIAAGQQLAINAVLVGDTTNQGVTWSLSPSVGTGTLSNLTNTSVTYVAPGSVAGNTPVTLTATSAANVGSTAALELTIYPAAASPGAAANVAAITTGGGPVAPSANSFYTSVTVCVPSTTNCQTIDNILVDTGSEGLRVLQSAMTSVVLPQLGDGAGNYFNNCVSFLDTSYLWGPVALADIYVGGESAGSAPIQLISSGSPTVPVDCSNGGTVNENTPTLLSANGILGIGLEPTDCFIQGTNVCDGSTTSIQPAYYLCASSGCATTDPPVTVSANQQVVNPVVLFGTDNNGTAITFPALPGISAPAADGSLVFGIATSTNNTIPVTATVFGLDAQDFFSTVLSGQTLSSSFIDTGSNGFFFPSSITACPSTSNAPGFYCPSAQQSLSATNGGKPTAVNFEIDNAVNLFAGSDSAFQTLGGPGPAGSFDWGAPFFYGRTVFTQIDGQSTPVAGFSPFWAY